MPKMTIDLDIPHDAAERMRREEETLRMAHRAELPVVTMVKIATAIVKRVAELPDRSSPDDWPEAMLVTSAELHRIILEEFDAEIG